MKIIPNYYIGNNSYKTNFCAKYPQKNENDMNVNIINCRPKEDNCIIDLEIDDIPYRFNENYPITRTDDIEGSENLVNMIENIKKTLSGTFISDGSKEIFIPYILGRTPDIKRDETLVRNGNTDNIYDEQFDFIHKELEDILDMDIEKEDITTINYLSKIKKSYDNNALRQAYGFYDKEEDVTYLYIPEKNKLQTLLDNGYVKSYHLE